MLHPHSFTALSLVLLPSLCTAAAAAKFSRRDVSLGVAPEDNHIALSKKSQRSVDKLTSPTRSRIAALKNASGASNGTTASETVNTIFSDIYPVANLTWGNAPGVEAGVPAQQFISFLDTGSSDTWVVTSALECVEIGSETPLGNPSACAFGNLYNLTQGQWTNITDLEFNIEYFPELEILRGDMAYAPISLAGLTVAQQEVALVDYAAWSGDGHSSGLLGLAYPSITSATNRTTGKGVEYNPLFTNMVDQGLVSDAVFTIALDQVPQNYSVLAPAGVMAVGGLVSEEYWVGDWTSVDIETTKHIGDNSELTWYTTTHEFVYGAAGANSSSSSSNNGSSVVSGGTFQSIVDCGTAPNFVPSRAAAGVNAQFVPPAVYNDTLGYWTVDCDATAPYAAYIIGGVEMPMRAENMIMRSLNGLQGYEDVCFSAFADGGNPLVDGPMIIGEVWQLGYVIAYDQGNQMMHFAERSGCSSY